MGPDSRPFGQGSLHPAILIIFRYVRGVKKILTLVGIASVLGGANMAAGVYRGCIIGRKRTFPTFLTSIQGKDSLDGTRWTRYTRYTTRLHQVVSGHRGQCKLSPIPGHRQHTSSPLVSFI